MDVWALIASHLEHLRNQRRSRAEIEAQQLRKFRKLVAFIAERSPYYRDLIRTRGIDIANCRVTDFPILTKADITLNFDAMVTDRALSRKRIEAFLSSSRSSDDLIDGRYYIMETSGTSGQLAIIPYSFSDWARGISHALRVNPFRPGQRRLAYIGAVGGHYTGVSFATSTQHSLLRFKYDIRPFDFNQSLDLTVDGLNAYRPDILMGYPNAIARLAERQRDGSLRISPRWVQTSGEPMHPADCSAIEDAFGVSPTRVYSCTENVIMGIATNAFGGMYLMEDDLIFEFASDHTLITNLFNRTLPLIRYRMSDVLTPIADDHGKWPFTKVREIAWRAEQAPVYKDSAGRDVRLDVSRVMGMRVPGIRRYQLEPIDESSCRLKACFPPSSDANARQAAMQSLREQFSRILEDHGVGRINCHYLEVDDLPPSPVTGKYAYVLPPARPGSAAPERVGLPS